MPFQFTRYLYVKEEVQLSLLISILKREKDESLFWAFELYYSGFYEDLRFTLIQIYFFFFATFNQSFGKYMINQLNQIKRQPIALAKVVCNLIARKYNLDVFLLKLQVSLFELENDPDHSSILNEAINIFASPFSLCKDFGLDNRVIELAEKCQSVIQEPSKYVRVSEDEIVLYETIIMGKQYRILQHAYRFEIDPHHYLNLFLLARESNGLRGIYLYHWDYFALLCTPFYQSKIHNYEIDLVKKQLCYEDDPTIDYNLEPDEQSFETQNKVLKNIQREKTWVDFIQEFGTLNNYHMDDAFVEELGKIKLFQQNSFTY